MIHYNKLQMTMLAVMAVLLHSLVHAEVIFDGTLGSQTTLPGPVYDIQADLGLQVGNNLFHSFSQFNINTDESAIFSGPNSIANIIGRVTGEKTSQIDGTLRTEIPRANFYLLNPAGIIFGPNARLDVDGSFHVSTADYLRLGKKGYFYASFPNKSVLFVAPPTAFGFLDNPTPINIQSSYLQLIDNKSLSITGGDIHLTNSFLHAPSGRINLISVASQGEIKTASMDVAHFAQLGNIKIKQTSAIANNFIGNLDISGNGSEGILIRAGQLLLDNAQINAQVFGTAQGGTIKIESWEKVRFTGNTALFNDTYHQGDAGEISINANEIILQDKSRFSSNSQGYRAGLGGDVYLTANTILMNDNAIIIGESKLGGGIGGSVFITTNHLQMTDSTRIRRIALGDNKAGDINITTKTFSMDGDATIDTGTYLNGRGNGGLLTITTDTLSMAEDAWIISDTASQGNGGAVNIQATARISMLDASVISSSAFGSGEGGTVNITTQQLTLSNSAVINSGTEGQGKGGNINIESDRLKMENKTFISTETQGQNFFSREGQIFFDSIGGGDAGNINLTANSFSLAKGAQINSGSHGKGMAGNIIVHAQRALAMQNGTISTKTTQADGGNITIEAPYLLSMHDSAITTSVQGDKGNGGNINASSHFAILNDSKIMANAYGGNGGNIYIIAEQFLVSAESLIDASSKLGIDGEVQINGSESELSDNLFVLPIHFLKVSPLKQCAILDSNKENRFVLERAGMPRDELKGSVLGSYLDVITD